MPIPEFRLDIEFNLMSTVCWELHHTVVICIIYPLRLSSQCRGRMFPHCILRRIVINPPFVEWALLSHVHKWDWQLISNILISTDTHCRSMCKIWDSSIDYTGDGDSSDIPKSGSQTDRSLLTSMVDYHVQTIPRLKAGWIQPTQVER